MMTYEQTIEYVVDQHHSDGSIDDIIDLDVPFDDVGMNDVTDLVSEVFDVDHDQVLLDMRNYYNKV